MSHESPRNPLVRPVPAALFARELARFWPQLARPEVALGDDMYLADDTRRLQIDLLAVDERQHLILIDARWDAS